MTDLLGPSAADTDGDAPSGDPSARVTEIGPPEVVDTAEHPTATVMGVVALLVVVVVALAGLTGLMTPESDSGRQVAEIVVPRVGGRPLPEAQATLERLGLIVDVRYAPNEVVPVDVVVDQEPIAGARLEVGEQVVLVVSDGPAGVRVPGLGELTTAEATRLLGVLGLSAVVEEVFDETVPLGAILGTKPAEGARVSPGTEVTVLLSRGPEPRTVPAVVGLDSAAAFVAIGRAELQVGELVRRVVADVEPGTVVSVEPGAGEQVPRGYPVEVVVAVAAEPVLVPDLVGFARVAASNIADELGLDVSVRTQVVPPGDRRDGRVISQSPVAGSPADAVGTITITVGVAPTPSTTTTTTPSGTPTTAPDN